MNEWLLSRMTNRTKMSASATSDRPRCYRHCNEYCRHVTGLVRRNCLPVTTGSRLRPNSTLCLSSRSWKLSMYARKSLMGTSSLPKDPLLIPSSSVFWVLLLWLRLILTVACDEQSVCLRAVVWEICGAFLLCIAFVMLVMTVPYRVQLKFIVIQLHRDNSYQEILRTDRSFRLDLPFSFKHKGAVQRRTFAKWPVFDASLQLFSIGNTMQFLLLAVGPPC